MYLNHTFLEGTGTDGLLVCRPATLDLHPLIVERHLLFDWTLHYIATHMNGSFDPTLADLNLLFGQWDRLLLFAGPEACFSGGRWRTGASASSILNACISKCHRMVFLQHAHYTVGGFWLNVHRDHGVTLAD